MKPTTSYLLGALALLALAWAVVVVFAWWQGG